MAQWIMVNAKTKMIVRPGAMVKTMHNQELIVVSFDMPKPGQPALVQTRTTSGPQRHESHLPAYLGLQLRYVANLRARFNPNGGS